MKYRTYRLNSEAITRLTRKNKMVKFKKKAKPIDMIQATLKWLYTNNVTQLSSMECTIHAEEYHWLSGDKRVYFPVDLEMAESIIKGTYSVKDENAFYDKPESFILNLPEGLSFNGNDHGSGLLVVVSPHDERAETVYGEFMNWIEQPPIGVTVDGEEGNFTIMITYQDSVSSEMYLRLAIPSFNAIKILHMNSSDEYIKYMRETNRFNLNHRQNFELDEEELRYQFEVMRFVCGFMVYKKALPDRVVSGLPAISSKVASSPLTKDKRNFTVKNPHGSHDASSGHYRSWHFRQLMADRYYRGEHKNKKIGSRVIFVSDSYVVRDIDAHTVKGEA